MSELTDIPVIDLRDGGAPRHVQHSAKRARALRDACLDIFPRAAMPLMPMLDRASRALARALALALCAGDRADRRRCSISRACGCSMRPINGAARRARSKRTACPGSCARSIGRSPVSAVTPRWRICAALAAISISVTWPGYVGALTAMAPWRFAACVNQAPMRRRTAHRWLRPYDFAVNAVAIWQSGDLMPPDQLLRQTFETCADYAAARRMLETTPVARPVIYSLVGLCGERALRHRAHRNRLCHAARMKRAPPMIGCRAGPAGKAASACAAS